MYQKYLSTNLQIRNNPASSVSQLPRLAYPGVSHHRNGKCEQNIADGQVKYETVCYSLHFWIPEKQSFSIVVAKSLNLHLDSQFSRRLNKHQPL